MFGFLDSQPKAPPRVPTDRVVRVGFFDDTLMFRTFVMYTLFVFDDVLDAERLRASLERVVSRPGWNKLGARLRRNDRGELEHHIPAAFAPDRPAVDFDHLDLSTVAAEDHPVAARIPRPPPSDGPPAIVGNPDDLAEFYLGPDTPRGLADYLAADRPELGLRVVSLRDKTIVVLHWLHLAFDAATKRALISAWTLALQGRDDEIPVPLDAGDYVLDEVGKAPTEPHALAGHCMSTAGMAAFVLRNVHSLAVCSKEHRMVCVPGAFFRRLREKALADLAASGEAEDEKPFLSEGDVLLAWVTRMAMVNMPKDSERTLAVQQIYQWRPVLTDLIPEGRPFLCNCIGLIATLVPARDALQKPLAHLASRIRRSIREQRSREQVEAYAELVRRDPRLKIPPFFGESTMQLLLFSNWQQADMFGTDLGEAAVTPRGGRPLRPSYIQSVQGPYNFSDGLIAVGKDQEGNYWFSGYRAQGLWGMMAEEMAKGEIYNRGGG